MGEKNPWQEHWGGGYDPVFKLGTVEKMLEALDGRNQIGNVVLDVGSGRHPVSKALRKPGRKILEADIASSGGGEETFKRIAVDAEQPSSSFGHKKAVVKAARFLGFKDLRDLEPEQVDTAIFSDILSYVDYQTAIKNVDIYLKVGGKVIIFNWPLRGFDAKQGNIFSERGVKDNRDLTQFLKSEMGYQVKDTIELDRPEHEGGGIDYYLRPPGMKSEFILAEKTERVKL
jgi:hypothetical protein